jgi:hypothetical protein
MIIGLSGYARSGKNTVASHLEGNHNFQAIAFADPIRELLMKLDPIVGGNVRVSDLVHEYGWETAKSRPEVRRLLQTLGVGAREVIDENIWINKALSIMNGEGNYVITDVRFKNEAHVLKIAGAQIWRVERQGVEAVNDHISEHDLDDWEFDSYIPNNSTLEDLMFAVDMALKVNA